MTAHENNGLGGHHRIRLWGWPQEGCVRGDRAQACNSRRLRRVAVASAFLPRVLTHNRAHAVLVSRAALLGHLSRQRAPDFRILCATWDTRLMTAMHAPANTTRAAASLFVGDAIRRAQLPSRAGVADRTA